MKKRVAYYVSRKNVLVWLAALALCASAALRIANVCGKGADARTVWLLVVLPVTGCALYALDILVGGKERFYRSSIPVLLLAVYYGLKISLSAIPVWLTFVFWVAYLAIAGFYTVTVSGHVKSTVPLLLLLAGTCAVLAMAHEKQIAARDLAGLREILPDFLFLFAGVLTVLATKIYLDDAYHPTWGDRSDGRKLRTLEPMSVVANYIMPTRGGSSNFIRESVEISAIERYIREKRKQGYTNFGITHVFLAAYVQCVAKYPATAESNAEAAADAAREQAEAKKAAKKPAAKKAESERAEKKPAAKKPTAKKTAAKKPVAAKAKKKAEPEDDLPF